MGEAIYFMKARWPSEDEAVAAMPKIETFLKRMAEAGDKWQEVRSQKEAGDIILRHQFSDVFDMLEIDKPDDEAMKKDCSLNYLAGQLDSPVGEYSGFEMFVEGDTVVFSGEVWHFADWEPLAGVLKKLGAEYTIWTSDEYSGRNELAEYTAPYISMERRLAKAEGGT